MQIIWMGIICTSVLYAHMKQLEKHINKTKKLNSDMKKIRVAEDEEGELGLILKISRTMS